MRRNSWIFTVMAVSGTFHTMNISKQNFPFLFIFKLLWWVPCLWYDDMLSGTRPAPQWWQVTRWTPVPVCSVSGARITSLCQCRMDLRSVWRVPPAAGNRSPDWSEMLRCALMWELMAELQVQLQCPIYILMVHYFDTLCSPNNLNILFLVFQFYSKI